MLDDERRLRPDGMTRACVEVLRRRKSCVGEAEYANDDGPTVKSIKKLANLLADVDDDKVSSDDDLALLHDEEEIGSPSGVEVVTR